MSKYVFQPPGKQYKKVKTVSERISNSEGIEEYHDVSVYLHAAGTPCFCIMLPTDYYETWTQHPHADEFVRRSVAYCHQTKMIRAGSFDEAVGSLHKIANHWMQHVRTRTMQKCIFIGMEVKTADGRTHNAPSFSSSQVLVGMNPSWGYVVAGRQYRPPRELDPLSSDVPAFKDLHAKRSEGIAIPFTPEAWAEVQRIYSVLSNAADRLMQLTNKDSAVALLASMASGVPLLAAADQQEGSE